MDGLDDVMVVTMAMQRNNGVLRERDHPQSRRTIAHLQRSGSIVRVLPGTFVDAARLTERRTRFAAALAASRAAVLWGDAAVAALTRTLDDKPFGSTDAVALAHAQFRRPTAAIRWVRMAVPAAHRVRVDGLRCPSAAFLAVERASRDDGALIQQFLRAGLITPTALAAALPALHSHPGQDKRRRLVRINLDNPWSGGEQRLQELLRQSRVTGWVANPDLWLDGRLYHPDVYFADAPLIVEFDGYGVHSKPEVFESDRVRQNVFTLHDIPVLRYTWKRLTTEPDAVVAEIRNVLAREMARHLPGGDA